MRWLQENNTYNKPRFKNYRKQRIVCRFNCRALMNKLMIWQDPHNPVIYYPLLLKLVSVAVLSCSSYLIHKSAIYFIYSQPQKTNS